MTYLIDGRHIQDHFPGIGRYVFNLIAALAQIVPEARLRVLCNPRARNTRFDLNLLARFSNVELKPVSAPPFSPAGQRLGMDRVLTGDAGLWHSAYYVMPYVVRTHTVVTLEDVIPLIYPAEIPNAAKRLLYRLLSTLAARRATQIITLSQSAAHEIERRLGAAPGKINVIPLAADRAFRPPSSGEREDVRERLGLPAHYNLYLGSNKPHKNLVRLVQAWTRVDTSAPLVIAGHWDDRYPEAKVEAEKRGIGERVRFIRNIAARDLPALMGGAELFLFPSLYEGFGLPPLEAMACGTPVACANASSLPEVVGNAALLFDPLDVDAIAEAATRALRDKGLRDDLVARGLERANQFSWERTARETLAVYRRVEVKS